MISVGRSRSRSLALLGCLALLVACGTQQPALNVTRVPTANEQTGDSAGDITGTALTQTINLGSILPGGSATQNVPFSLVCTGKTHIARGITVTYTPSETFISGNAAGPSELTETTSSVVIPNTWPLTTTGGGNTNCTTPPQRLPLTATITVNVPGGATSGARSVLISYSPSDLTGFQGNANQNTLKLTVNYTVAPPPDTTPPTVTINALAPDGLNGWYVNAPVDVTVSANDNTSVSQINCTLNNQAVSLTGLTGIGTTSASGHVSLNAEGSSSLSCTARDASNQTSSPASQTFKIDTVDPVVTATPDRAANAGGWYTAALTVGFSGADSGSSNVVCDADASYNGPDSATASVSGSCTDEAGNTGSKTLSFKYDATAPSIAYSLTPNDPASTGWYNIGTGAPVMSFTCSDATSGLADGTCPAEFTFGNGSSLSHSGTVTDKAGNSASAGVSDIKVDLIAPSITAALSPSSPASTGWYNNATGAPTVSFTCSDGGSGLASGACPSSHLFGDGENQSRSGTITDKAGNSASASVSDVDVDTTAPSISASVSPNAASTGWYTATTGAPMVSFTCSDATSGLAATCPTTHTFGNGTNQSFGATVSDSAGNSASANVSGIDVDLIAPAITASLSPSSPASTGWYNASTGAPSVSFTCSDTGSSGLAGACPSSHAFGDGANQSKTGTISDIAGNTASASVSGVDVDTTAPTLTATLSPNTASTGWYNASTGAPTVSFTCSDATSGLLAACPASHAFGNGAGQAFSQTISDKAGNSTTNGVSGVNVDLVAPSITYSLSPASPAGNGWYNIAEGKPTISFTCADADGSGLAGACPADFTFPDGANKSHSGSISDVAGNTASTGVTGLNVDTTAPTITASVTPSPASSGWYNIGTGAPSLNFTCADATSGLTADACPTSHAFGNGANQGHQGTVTDKAGNEASAGVTGISVDLIAPAITAALTPANPASSGWYNIATGAPSVNFTCADAGSSGLAGSCPSSHAFGEGANQSYAGTISDVAGNTAFANVSSVDVDLTAPTLTASLSPSAASSGWYNLSTGAPSLNFTCTDATSGIASGACPTTHLFGEGASQSYTQSVADQAGNTTSAGVSSVNVDLTKPSISAALSPSSPASTGWYNAATGAPSVNFTCSDGGSGLASGACPSSHTFGDGANQGKSGTVTDKAGNSASVSVTNVDVDTTAPSLTATLSPNTASTGWYNASTGAPTVSFTCADATSGLLATCPSSHAFGNGASQGYSQTISDKAGNSTSAGVNGVNVDLIAPTISAAVAPNAAGTGWYNIATGAPTVTFTCSDTGSAGLAPSACPASHTFGNGPSQSKSGTVTDVAGNSASAGVTGISVDLVAPTITASISPAAASTGWYNIGTGAPSVSFNCADTGSSGLAATCPASYTFPEGSALTVSRSITDVAGNGASAGFSNINVDLTRPALNIAATTSGAYGLCAKPNRPNFNPTDALSGIASQTDSWTTPSTGSGVGAYSYTATATDKAGNTVSDSRSYTINYGAAVSIFQQPINMDGSSRFKLGSTVPVKFQALCNGVPVTNVVAKLYVRLADNTPDAGIDEAISTAASTTGNLFRYDAVGQQYIFNLSTKGGYVDNPGGAITAFTLGTWTISAVLDDGTTRSVNIQLPK